MSKKTNEQDPLHAAAEAQPAHAQKPRTAEERLQELQAHQLELETQNKQLRQLRVVLEESLAHYTGFFEYAHVGYLILNQNGIINEINFTGAALLGVARSKLIHDRLDNFIAMGDRQRWQSHFIQVMVHRHIHCSFLLA